MVEVLTKSLLHCQCGCGRRFPPLKSILKRFASAECRSRWHNEQRAKALALAEAHPELLVSVGKEQAKAILKSGEKE